MVRKAEIKTVEGLRGGKGKHEMHHILKRSWKNVCTGEDGAAQQHWCA